MILAISAHPQFASLKIPRRQFVARERTAVRNRVIDDTVMTNRFYGKSSAAAGKHASAGWRE
jgi:hypothetical protein